MMKKLCMLLCALFLLMPTAAFAAEETLAAQPVYLVEGVIYADGTASVSSCMTSQAVQWTTQSRKNGESYWVALNDAAGQVLAAQPVNPSFLFPGEPPTETDSYYFQVVFPVEADAVSVAILSSDEQPLTVLEQPSGGWPETQELVSEADLTDVIDITPTEDSDDGDDDFLVTVIMIFLFIILPVGIIVTAVLLIQKCLKKKRSRL